MSNQVNIDPCIFTNPWIKSKTYGYKWYDNYSSGYCTNFDSIPKTPIKFLEKVLTNECDENFDTLINFIVDNEMGINIGGNWLDYNEIANLLNTVLD